MLRKSGCGRQHRLSYNTNRYVKAQTGHSHTRQIERQWEGEREGEGRVEREREIRAQRWRERERGSGMNDFERIRGI